MKYETKLIAIGTWTGPAYLIDGVWYVRPQSIGESMGLDWVKARKKLVGLYAGHIRMIQRGAGMGKQKPILMSLDAAVRWLAGYAGNNHMQVDRRIVATEMALAIARQFAEMAVENGCAAASDDIVVLGGRHE